MLVLSRRVGESVMIGDDVVLTIVEVRGDIVRVGIDAPRDVKVHREEVYREVEAANRAAATETGELSAAAALARLPSPTPPPVSPRPGPPSSP